VENMENLFRYANKITETAKDTGSFAKKTIPTIKWMQYAALRLGTFIMSYAAIIGITVILFAISGIMLSFGAIIALVPVAIFIAIRISGALTQKTKPKE
tara:strand:+ start:672 stop:968 length:297 start_codon:yes stop_codon:yes gene_type:complete